MLVLTGRCVGLDIDTYTKDNGTVRNTNRLTVATDKAPITVLIPDELLARADVLALRTFGTAVEILCQPAFDYDYGKPKPSVRAEDLNVLADLNGEVVGSASNGS